MSKEIVDAISNGNLTVALNLANVTQSCEGADAVDYTINPEINIGGGSVGGSPADCDDQQTINGQDVCLKCTAGYPLDLESYTCVESCPDNSISIASNSTFMGKGFSFCRPISKKTATYYIQEEGNNGFEAGT